MIDYASRLLKTFRMMQTQVCQHLALLYTRVQRVTATSISCDSNVNGMCIVASLLPYCFCVVFIIGGVIVAFIAGIIAGINVVTSHGCWRCWSLWWNHC